MTTNCYHFLREELPDLSFVYQFTTFNNSAYTVYFDISGYDMWLADYPYMLENGYTFGFFRKRFNTQSNVFDERTAATICRIVEDFMALKGTDCILLYHCDMADLRQKFRSRLFHRWYHSFDTSDKLVKRDIELTMPHLEVEKCVSYYISFIMNASNTNAEMINEEFKMIAVDLVYAISAKQP